MAILVTILKWIGILLLCLLGLILFLVLMVLFYPVTYQAKGELGERIPEDITVTIRIRWFFSMVGVVLMYRDSALSGKLSILGIPVRRFPGSPKKKRQIRRKKKEKAAAEEETVMTTETLPEISRTETRSAAVEEEGVSESAEWKKSGMAARIRRIELATRSKIRQIIEKIRAIPAFFRTLWDKLSNIRSIVGDDDNRKAVKFVLAELLQLLKKCGPGRIATDLTYCAGDPALTGQVLAILSMMPFLYCDKVGIRPDFDGETFYVRGTFSLKGHIQTVSLVRTALHIYKNKQVKKMIHNVRL